jgi:hypothetical protein
MPKNIPLKPRCELAIDEFQLLLNASCAFAKKKKLTKRDVSSAIKRVRNANRVDYRRILIL